MQHVLIIGGTAGIGRHLAEMLLKDGHRVTIAGRDLERSSTIADEIARTLSLPTGLIGGVQADLSRPHGLAQSLRGVSAIDHLVLAGINRDRNTIREFDIAKAVELVTTKLVGYTVAVQTLLDRLSKDGSILIFGGMAKDVPYPGSTMVTSVNSGVMGLVRTLGIELAPLRVNAIHPGAVADSPYWAGNATVLASALERVRAARLPTMDDIVDGCRFLMRNGAANGINLNLDGGFA